jgi:hypothetical protein
MNQGEVPNVLKSSRSVALVSLVIGAIAACVFYYFWPHATIWGYFIVGLIVAGACYKPLLEQSAYEKILDGDKPRKRGLVSSDDD